MKESKIIRQATVIDYLAKNKTATDDKEWRERVGKTLKWHVDAGTFTEDEAIELAIRYTTW